MTKRTPRRIASLLMVVLSLAAVRALEGRGQTSRVAHPVARRVIVISVDGMGAQFYNSPHADLRIPHLMQMKSEGSFAEAVEGVYPTVTYPSHTTIVTGQFPAAHGVYTNLSSRAAGKNPRDWFWFAKAIKVPTLWDVAHKARLTAASVFWPVTAGASIDWDLPEIWDPAKGEVPDPTYVAKFATPGLLMEALLTIGPPPAGQDLDLTKTHLATFLLKRHKPNLMLIHLDTLDETEHRFGPDSAEAAATLEHIDDRIGEIVSAVKTDGLAGSTDFFIVSDHGFMPVDRAIQPNVLLAKAGLLTADASGQITGGKIATVSNGGSFFIYWPSESNLRSEVDAALKPLRDQGLAWAVFDGQALKEMGADPGAQMALEPPRGAMYSDAATGPVVTELEARAGSHGYLPYRSGLEASFIAWGPDIKAGIDLHRIRMTSIAPTLLKALGIRDPHFGSQPALDEIFK